MLMMAVTIVERTVEKFLSEEKIDTYDGKVKWKVANIRSEGICDWKYQIVTKGWRVTPEQMQLRRKLMKRCCFARILKKMTDKKETLTEYREWSPETEKAICGLMKLGHSENGIIRFGNQEFTTRPRRWSEVVRDGTAAPMIDRTQRQGMPEVTDEISERQSEEMEGERNRKHELYALWIEFAYSERQTRNWFERMPTTGTNKCFCGKGSISYPHWPPTSIEEAREQFEMCQDERNEHRRNLVVQWWRFFNDIADITPWRMSEPQQRYINAEKIIRESSPIVQQELERSTTIRRRKRPKRWGCREYCERVLREKECSCVCHCEEHRDECPIHAQQ